MALYICSAKIIAARWTSQRQYCFTDKMEFGQLSEKLGYDICRSISIPRCNLRATLKLLDTLANYFIQKTSGLTQGHYFCRVLCLLKSMVQIPGFTCQTIMIPHWIRTRYIILYIIQCSCSSTRSYGEENGKPLCVNFMLLIWLLFNVPWCPVHSKSW